MADVSPEQRRRGDRREVLDFLACQLADKRGDDARIRIRRYFATGALTTLEVLHVWKALRAASANPDLRWS